MDGWNDILKVPPKQGQRVLVRLLDKKVRITSYDRFSWEHWAIAYWRPMPENSTNSDYRKRSDDE
jgi:hypothetical protein